MDINQISLSLVIKGFGSKAIVITMLFVEGRSEMWWVVLAIIIYYLLLIRDQQNYLVKDLVKNKGETIGKVVKKNGYYYINIGDIDDNDNWVITAKAEPIYYVNVYKKAGAYYIMIEDFKSNSAIESWKCEAESHTKKIVHLQKDHFQHLGKVVIDARMSEIERILREDPFYVKKREIFS